MDNKLTEYLEPYFEEVNAMEFYRFLFLPGGLQEKGVYEKGRYNAILVEIT